MRSRYARTSTRSTSRKSQSTGGAVEHVVEEIAHDLHVALPTESSNPFWVRIITLLTLLGGVAIVGGVFADSYSLYHLPVAFYFFRLTIGFLLIFIAFGLNQRKLYAIWLFGLVVVLGLLLNPIISFLPILALVYLYRKRSMFAQTGVVTYKKFTVKF